MEPFLNPAQTVADLRNAANLLRERNWDQGQNYRYDTDAFCAFGAIRTVVGGLIVDPADPYGYRCRDETHVANMLFGPDSAQYREAARLRDRASNAARAFYRFFGLDIVLYNDAEGRTKEQMIRALETVATTVEEDPRRA
jgi:hypothetical protein